MQPISTSEKDFFKQYQPFHVNAKLLLPIVTKLSRKNTPPTLLLLVYIFLLINVFKSIARVQEGQYVGNILRQYSVAFYSSGKTLQRHEVLFYVIIDIEYVLYWLFFS